MPLLGPTMEGRNHVFQRLKPICVALSQAALALNGPAASPKLVAERLNSLKQELTAIVAKPYALDEKLADYAFFPLSQILKASQRVSIRCLELAFQCLAILIEQGWRARVQEQLAAQVLILCTLMAEKNPKGLAASESTDELQASALCCLCCLFAAVSDAPQIRSKFTSEENFPQLGQTITTILDALISTDSIDGQIAATTALQTLVSKVASHQAQAAFLPGITSKLTKVLTPQTTQRRNHAVLVGSLDVLCKLFVSTLSDVPFGTPHSRSELSNVGDESFIANPSWLEAAAPQLKTALTSIVRLKDHSRLDVKEAIVQLCFVIVKNCRTTLANCVPLALETIFILASRPEGDAIKFRTEALIASSSELSTLAQETMHDWMQSLTIHMHAADKQMKIQRMLQLQVVYDILVSSGTSMITIDRVASNVMRESVAILFRDSDSKHDRSAVVPLQSLDISVLGFSEKVTHFGTPLLQVTADEQVLGAMQQLLEAFHSTSNTVAYAGDLARSLRQTQDDMQLANFWLLLNIVGSSLRTQNDFDAFLALDDTANARAHATYLDELYSFSLDVLSRGQDNPVDPRFSMLALRTLALRAQSAGSEFCFELIDALYPVLHTLATPDDRLQQDSITTLNIFTDACGYTSVQDLIVQNVDYLTNAVALKLNAFDVSPQAPQVLLMMVRLAGPSLLPYLEDTVDSIFAALEDYHGYPVLVELLFRVLSVVAEEGTKAPQLAITHANQAELGHLLHPSEQTSVNFLLRELRERATEVLSSSKSGESALESHPQQPWQSPDEDAKTRSTAEDGSDHADEIVADIELPPPAPKTYKILLKISDLTQHFLPSASASLRTSLLALVKTTIPAIAQHENSFLPLINTLWPELVSRLDDTELQIVANALDVVALLCEHARDFMRSRILQLWPRLLEIWQKATSDIGQTSSVKTGTNRGHVRGAEMASDAQLRQSIIRFRTSPGDYSDTIMRALWNSLVNVTKSIVQHVEIPPEIFDEALYMMGPTLDDANIRTAFERRNADAVWLLDARSGMIPLPDLPELPASHAGLTMTFAQIPG